MVIVVCSQGYHFSSIVVGYLATAVDLYCNFYGYEKESMEKFTLRLRVVDYIY